MGGERSRSTSRRCAAAATCSTRVPGWPSARPPPRPCCAATRRHPSGGARHLAERLRRSPRSTRSRPSTAARPTSGRPRRSGRTSTSCVLPTTATTYRVREVLAEPLALNSQPRPLHQLREPARHERHRHARRVSRQRHRLRRHPDRPGLGRPGLLALAAPLRGRSPHAQRRRRSTSPASPPASSWPWWARTWPPCRCTGS